jgi:hypothetical protein
MEFQHGGIQLPLSAFSLQPSLPFPFFPIAVFDHPHQPIYHQLKKQ